VLIILAFWEVSIIEAEVLTFCEQIETSIYSMWYLSEVC